MLTKARVCGNARPPDNLSRDSGLHIWIGLHDIRRAAHDNATAFHQVVVLDNIKCHGSVLLDEKHRDFALIW